jgi:uncharacterized membrane protein YccF (DUF307 family)
LTGTDDVGTSALGTLRNVLWFVVCGWWLALGHLLTAAALFVTIIGIPFGIQHVKIAALTLSPIGKTVVREEVAEAARRGEGTLDRAPGHWSVGMGPAVD